MQCPPSQARVKEFPHAVVKKIFVFGHSFDGGQDLDGFKNKENLVIFPPEGDIDAGMSMVSSASGVFSFSVSSSCCRLAAAAAFHHP